MSLEARAAELDQADELASFRRLFQLPEDVVYLDGNSLGALPNGVKARVTQAIEQEWGQSLIRAWNEYGWVNLPEKLGDRIARLIGAEKGSVTVGDSTSISVFKVLAAALAFNADRKVILSDRGNFPTDLYMAQGLAALKNTGHRLSLVEPEDVLDAITEDVSVLMLTEVDYRTGRRHDMKKLTGLAHQKGVLTIWDLAHSAGAFPVDLSDAGADFAVGCGYKYLNGGPGAPAFAYVAPSRLHDVKPFLSGWFGHEAPFAFDLDYRPAEGTTKLRVGTPPVLSLVALDAALDVFDNADMQEIQNKSNALSEFFIGEVEALCPDLVLASPRNAQERGSQVSFRHPDGYAIMQALIDKGVIGDFRAPDIIRFGFAPLYVRFADVAKAVLVLAEILDSRLWDRDTYKTRAAVT
ncbi:MAG: kynureninase [Stappiaceae bacterium]